MLRENKFSNFVDDEYNCAYLYTMEEDEKREQQ